MTVVGPTLTLTVFHKPINLVLPLSIFDIIPHLSPTVTMCEALLSEEGTQEEVKELQREKRRDKRDENVSVESKASGLLQAGPAKSNELIACRGPVGAAVL